LKTGGTFDSKEGFFTWKQGCYRTAITCKEAIGGRSPIKGPIEELGSLFEGWWSSLRISTTSTRRQLSPWYDYAMQCNRRIFPGGSPPPHPRNQHLNASQLRTTDSKSIIAMYFFPPSTFNRTKFLPRISVCFHPSPFTLAIVSSTISWSSFGQREKSSSSICSPSCSPMYGQGVHGL
jgi:hypothetical protein